MQCRMLHQEPVAFTDSAAGNEVYVGQGSVVLTRMFCCGWHQWISFPLFRIRTSAKKTQPLAKKSGQSQCNAHSFAKQCCLAVSLSFHWVHQSRTESVSSICVLQRGYRGPRYFGSFSFKASFAAKRILALVSLPRLNHIPACERFIRSYEGAMCFCFWNRFLSFKNFHRTPKLQKVSDEWPTKDVMSPVIRHWNFPEPLQSENKKHLKKPCFCFMYTVLSKEPASLLLLQGWYISHELTWLQGTKTFEAAVLLFPVEQRTSFKPRHRHPNPFALAPHKLTKLQGDVPRFCSSLLSQKTSGLLSWSRVAALATANTTTSLTRGPHWLRGSSKPCKDRLPKLG